MLTQQQILGEKITGKHHADRPAHEKYISLKVLHDRDSRILKAQGDKEWSAWFEWAEDTMGCNA